jgi:hypothetical protein
LERGDWMLSFGERFYEAMVQTPSFKKKIKKVVLPSNSQLRKAQVSSAVGYMVGKTIGIGWHSTTNVTIHFKDSPIQMAKIIRDRDTAKLFFYKLISSKRVNSGECWICARTKGTFRETVTGLFVATKRNTTKFPGAQLIANDRSLLVELLDLMKNRDFYNINKSAKIAIQIDNTGSVPVYEIRVNLYNRAFKEKVTLLRFATCIMKIADHVNTALQI